MTDRTWTGSVNHNARNPNNWDPTGAPRQGDNLTLPFGSTIGVAGHDLKGDTLTIPSSTSSGTTTTLNLSTHADVSLKAPGGGFGNAVIVNVGGSDTLTATLGSQFDVTVKLNHHASLNGNLSLANDTVTVSGDTCSSFINDGMETLAGSTATINTKVLGLGTFSLEPDVIVTPNSDHGSTLEFGGFVSAGQTIAIAGVPPPNNFAFSPTSSLTVDHPDEFHGTVNFVNDAALADLANLATADDWTYKNDMLSIRDGAHHVIDRIHVLSEPTVAGSVHGLSVSKDAAGDVLVKPGADFHGSLT